jgi:hypothetical protein
MHMTIKLGAFISGVFGTVGFGISVLAGVGSGNAVESILTRGLVTAGVCYIVGYGVGIIAQQVAHEQAGRISKMVAEQDNAAEQKRLEEQAAADAQVAADAAEAPAIP